MQRTTTAERNSMLRACSAAADLQVIAAQSDSALVHNTLLRNPLLCAPAARLLLDADLVDFSSSPAPMSPQSVGALLDVLEDESEGPQELGFVVLLHLFKSGLLTDDQLAFLVRRTRPDDAGDVLALLGRRREGETQSNPLRWLERSEVLAAAVGELMTPPLSGHRAGEVFFAAAVARLSNTPPVHVDLTVDEHERFAELLATWRSQRNSDDFDLCVLAELLALPCCTDEAASEVLAELARDPRDLFLTVAAWWLHSHPSRAAVVLESFAAALNHLEHINPETKLWQLLDAAGRAFLLDSLATSTVPADCYRSLTDEEVGLLHAERLCDRLGERCVADTVMAVLERGCGDRDSLEVAVAFVAGGFPGTVATALQVAAVFFGEGKTRLPTAR